MKILFKNAAIPDRNAPDHTRRVSLAVDGDRISYIGEVTPEGAFDRAIDCDDALLVPGFINAHCHTAMTLFRSLGGGLPTQRWLDEAILPAEDRLTPELTELASSWAIAEMIAGGTTSFSDLYFFCEATAHAAANAGIRANVARGVVSFDPDADPASDTRVRDAIALYDEWNGIGGMKIDFSLHAEYTNVPRVVEYIAKIASDRGAMMQIHISETAREQEKCVAKYGKTPAAFFDDLGALTDRTVLAHCVHVTPGDIALIAERGATVVHCPRSNLKLGSGVAPLRAMLDAGVNVALGTDGAASNNRLSMLDEYGTAALIHPGVNQQADLFEPSEFLPLLSENGARAQGRADVGSLSVGMKADLCLLDTSAPGASPMLDAADHLAFTASPSQVRMTVCDGRVLYENGEYKTIDIEKLRFDFSLAAEQFHKRR